MISYEAEGYGRLFQDVVPVKKMENEQTSVGSNTELEIHTEQAFSKLRPDILSLACIRGDPLAQTYILPVMKILENMDDDERKSLRLPLWKTGVDLSFKLNGNDFIEGDIRGPFPIISGDNKHPKLLFDQDLMFGVNEHADNLIKKIINIYYKYRNQHNLQSGEIILIDNMRALHGRSPFYPKYDGNDRFLIRCFAVYDFQYSSYARDGDSRIVSAIYS
jgi:L-asparagine oxygenase